MNYRLFAVVTLLASFVVVSATAQNATPVRNPALVKSQYQEVAAHLDPDGDLYVVANIDGVAKEMINTVVGIIESASASQGDAPPKLTKKLPAFLEKNGLYAARCVGMSAVPRSDGLNGIKVFISRDSSAAALPFWRGMFGGTKPVRLRSLDCLPANTVMARVFNGSMPDLWALIRGGVAELSQPETLKAFNASVSNMSSRIGMKLDSLITSLGDEGFISIQLSQDSTTQIPIGMMDQVTIPTPSLLIGAAVKDDSLVKALEAQFTKAALPLIKAQMGDAQIQSVNLPLPLPIPFQISFATCSGFFLLGTTTEVVTDAIQALQKKNGLVQTEQFKTAFKGLPMENNGITYIDKRFSKTVMDLQSQMLSMTANSPQAAPGQAIAEALKKIQPQSSAVVFMNMDKGIFIHGTGTSGGKEIVSSMTMFPIGILAGIAVPSFVKARQTSQKNACINNLRMLDSAKEQWAMTENKKDGDVADDKAILQYVKHGKLPTCPAGGAYKLNPIGEAPECSMPDHKMDW